MSSKAKLEQQSVDFKKYSGILRDELAGQSRHLNHCLGDDLVRRKVRAP